VAVAAVGLAASALGFLLWFLVTRSANQLAWQTSLATVLAVVLPSWAMSAAMLTWVMKSRAAEVIDVRRGITGGAALLRTRPLAELDPFDLEVHRPVDAGTSIRLPRLPRYVSRQHDELLRKVAADAAEGMSRFAVLVGGSSTGKTRACWEALRVLRGHVPQWVLWHPIDPGRPEAFLVGIDQVRPFTVVWLNEAQLYLDTPDSSGEKVAAGLRELLRDPARAPVLVLATLWPAHWDTLTTRAEPDSHAQARELLASRKIDVPDAFSEEELATLRREAEADSRLARAASEASDGQVIQYLAGVPVLMDRYRQAPSGARALIHAAMDARRLGCGLHLPLDLLAGAAPGYLTDQQWDQMGKAWLDQALAYASKPCNGIPGPLTRVRPRDPADSLDASPLYRLADYLDQHGRHERHARIPPPAFWAAAPCCCPEDLSALAWAAYARGLLRAAAQLSKCALRQDALAARLLVAIMHGCCPADDRPAEWAAAHAALDDAEGISGLLEELSEKKEQNHAFAALADRVAAQIPLDDPAAIARLLRKLHETGAQKQALVLANRVAVDVTLIDADGVVALLAGLRDVGAREQALVLADRAVTQIAISDTKGISSLLYQLHAMGAPTLETILLARDPVTHVAFDHPDATNRLLNALHEINAHDQATVLASRAAAEVSVDDPKAVSHLLYTMWLFYTMWQVDMRSQAAVLARRAAAEVGVDDPEAVSSLLFDMWRVDAHDQAAVLASRVVAKAVATAVVDALKLSWLVSRLRLVHGEQLAVLAGYAAAHASVDDPQVARLVGSLQKADMLEQAAALAARAAAGTTVFDLNAVPRLVDVMSEMGANEEAVALASRALAYTALNDPGGFTHLDYRFHKIVAREQIIALADQAAAHTSLDRVYGVARLLDWMRIVRSKSTPGQVAVLAARAAAHTPLDDLQGVARLLRSLREAEAHEQVAILASRAAVDCPMDDPQAIGFLLDELRALGAEDQAAVLLARDPARHVMLQNLHYVIFLLYRLKWADALEQGATLAERAAHADLDGETVVADLLDAMRAVRAHTQVAFLLDRLPGEGMFQLFCAQQDQEALYNFGREPDGSPTRSWGWNDLN